MAARTRIAVQQAPENGQPFLTTGAYVFTAADATNGMDFENTGREIIVAKNGNASTRTVTILGITDENGRSSNVVHTVPAFATPVQGTIIGGPFPDGLFGSVCQIDINTAADLSLAVIRLPGRIG